MTTRVKVGAVFGICLLGIAAYWGYSEDIKEARWRASHHCVAAQEERSSGPPKTLWICDNGQFWKNN